MGMKPLYNQRYPINSKLNDPHTVRIGGMDVVDWRPSIASRFDVTIVDRPEDKQTEDYLALPREEDEEGEVEENSETEDYLTLPREDDEEYEDEENSETEDYLALPREEDEEDEVEENSETEDYEFVPRNDHGPGGDHAVRRTRYLRR